MLRDAPPPERRARVFRALEHRARELLLRGRRAAVRWPIGDQDLEVTGRVFNIQRFSLDDGPGIRTTVFLKGCSLSCAWCSNPESIAPGPELLSSFATLCQRCGRCVARCESGALAWDGPAAGTPPRLDRARCRRCLRCAATCPSGALRGVGRIRRAAEVVAEVIKDEPFYAHSHGGVTLSGGEPLLQPEFCRAILRACARRGLHTALDTAGHAPQESLAQLLPFLDLVLYDLKLADPVLHRRWTGSDNRRVIENLHFLDGQVRLWLRVPLIPGVNDDDAAIEALAALCRGLRLERIVLLPYHRFGSGKYLALGRPYELEGLGAMTAAHAAAIGRRLRAHLPPGVAVEVSGGDV